MKEVEDCLERLEDEWARVQHKRMKNKKECYRRSFKKRMDLILRVDLRLQKCKQSLQDLHMIHVIVWSDRKQKKKWRSD